MTSLRRYLVLREICGYENGVVEYVDTPVAIINNVPPKVSDQKIFNYLSKKIELIFEIDRFHYIISSKEMDLKIHLFEKNIEWM